MSECNDINQTYIVNIRMLFIYYFMLSEVSLTFLWYIHDTS